MNYHCRSCSSGITPTSQQISKTDFICNPCKRKYQKAWRLKKKLAGTPVKSGKMSASWHREYEQAYKNRPGVKDRRNANMRTYRTDPRHSHKHKARWILNKAVQNGVIIKEPCARCGRKAEAHHPDYAKPLEVIWLCRKHHNDLHKAEGRDGK